MFPNNLQRASLLCGLLFLQFTSSAYAIVNVEDAIVGRAAEGVHAKADLLANGANGNTEKSMIKADVLSFFQHDQYAGFLQLQYAYGKSRGAVDTDRAFAHLRHRTTINPVWGVEMFAQIGRDPFARLAQRTLLGGGMRATLLESDKKSAVYLGIGAFHEHEVLNSKLGTSDSLNTNLWRANSYFVVKNQLNEQLRVYSTTYFQPAISDAQDYRVLEQASMLVKLVGNLDLKLSLDITFDARPPQNVQKRDVLYSTGLEYNF